MPILFRCEHCRQKMSISSRKAGQMLNCPQCQNEVMVPIPKSKGAAKEPLPPTRELPQHDDADSPANEDKGWAPTKEFVEKQPAGLGATKPLQPALARAVPPPQPPSLIFPARAPAEVEEEEFTFRKARTEVDEMDLTPMVDVTFLLLIFFMITASFSLTKTIESPAPDPESQGAQVMQTQEELEETSVWVIIDAEDQITIKYDETYEDTPVDPYDLEDVLGDKLRQENKNELIIQASPLSRHETFVSVFDAATGAGMQKIRLVASSADE